MKRKSANRTDKVIYREYVVTVSMPQILDKQKRKAAKAQLRAAIAAIFDPLEETAAELLPGACRMEIEGFADGTHVVVRGGSKIVPHTHRGQ